MLKADILVNPEPMIDHLQNIYKQYCSYKKFESVMPIFDSEFLDSANNIIAYYDEDTIVAFSLLRSYDSANVEAIQFAWDYKSPDLRLGIESLKHECAYYKSLGYEYLYLGQSEEYKNQIDGYEVLGTL